MSSLDHLLQRTVNVNRRARVADGVGGHTGAFSLNGTLLVHIRDASFSERLRAMREEAEVTHVLYVAAGVDLQRDDQVVDGSETYDVDAIFSRRRPGEDAIVHHVEARLIRRQAGT